MKKFKEKKTSKRLFPLNYFSINLGRALHPFFPAPNSQSVLLIKNTFFFLSFPLIPPQSHQNRIVTFVLHETYKYKQITSVRSYVILYLFGSLIFTIR